MFFQKTAQGNNNSVQYNSQQNQQSNNSSQNWYQQAAQYSQYYQQYFQQHGMNFNQGSQSSYVSTRPCLHPKKPTSLGAQKRTFLT